MVEWMKNLFGRKEETKQVEPLGMSFESKKEIIDLITKNEGGWVNDKDDKGGETFKGIARNYHPTWSGWKIIDTITNKKTNQIFENAELDKLVVDFYVNIYFPTKCFDIDNKGVLFCILDWLTTSKWATKKIQQAFNITVDNVFGDITVKVINSKKPIEAIDKITDARVRYYKSLKNPKFEKGWLKRCDHTKKICLELIG